MNYATSGAAITSPWWLPQLEVVSQTASILLPILGAIWLLIQISIKLWEFRANKSRKND